MVLFICVMFIKLSYITLNTYSSRTNKRSGFVQVWPPCKNHPLLGWDQALASFI